MSRQWTPSDVLPPRAPMHVGRAVLVERGRLATGSTPGRGAAVVNAAPAPDAVPGTAHTAGGTARSVSPEERLPGRAVGAPGAEPPLTIAGPGQETILRGRVHPDPRAFEQPLRARPAIHDARVIGVPRDSSGKLVCARVVTVGRPALTTRERDRFPRDARAAGATSDPPTSSTPSRRPGDGR